MAKIKGLKKYRKRLKKVVGDLVKDPVLLNKIGKEVLKSIKGETIGGFSPKRGEKLDDLSPSYIEQRKAARKRGDSNLSDLMRPTKAGNVYTGQLMDSLRLRVEGNKITIEPTGTRDDGLTNKEVAEKLKDQDRGFLGLDEEQNDIVERLFKEGIRRAFRKTGLKK